MAKQYKCETCKDTGWYGDNGSGIRGNNEYQACDMCNHAKAIEKCKNAIKNVSTPHIRDLNKDSMLSYREQLSSLYFEIEGIATRMATCLECAEDYPADVSAGEATDVRIFLKETGILMGESFSLFIGMSEK